MIAYVCIFLLGVVCGMFVTIVIVGWSALSECHEIDIPVRRIKVVER